MKKTFHEICDESKKNIKVCSVKDVINMKVRNEDFYLVDTREDNEFIKSHIKGAIHIGRGILERDIHLHIPDHSGKIVLYCGGGYRSVLAAESLQKMGYEKVFSMDGGWKGWVAEDGEVE